jgi:hypothetical protein
LWHRLSTLKTAGSRPFEAASNALILRAVTTAMETGENGEEGVNWEPVAAAEGAPVEAVVARWATHLRQRGVEIWQDEIADYAARIGDAVAVPPWVALVSTNQQAARDAFVEKPSRRRGLWSAEDDAYLRGRFAALGPAWTQIAEEMEGRLPIDVAGRWYRLAKGEADVPRPGVADGE